MTTHTPPLPAARRGEELRLAGLCGLLAFFIFNAAWIASDLSQPRAFHPADHDLSDLGALTANSPWLYNQLAANLSGLLVIVLGIGLWQAQAPGRRGWLGVAGPAAVLVAGLGTFLDGIFRLDCQAIDTGCVNDSWHSHAHKIESGVTAAAIFATLFLLPFLLRRLGARWRPFIAAVPLLLAANIAFSVLGDGAATRAGTVVVFAAVAYAGLQLLQHAKSLLDATNVISSRRAESRL